MSVMHNYGKEYILENGVTGVTFRAMLMSNAYVPNADDQFVDDVDADEISVSGYSRQTLASVAIIMDLPNDKVSIDCADINWGSPAAGATPQFVQVFARIGGSDNPAVDILICALEFTPTPTNGQSYVTTIPADGFAGDP